ncbi:hypothetical protein A8C56_20415 [Niabella ginsenosidivorans]|uniref:Uncharacterized protein n=1 Tax=Niabella ginsenosidivorans TaxID=1176587 RepID=A0A1A9I641_9BACT|nr:hypothetical protein A8C56_20415 [Niabella ginsenosidivorans]
MDIRFFTTLFLAFDSNFGKRFKGKALMQGFYFPRLVLLRFRRRNNRWIRSTQGLSAMQKTRWQQKKDLSDPYPAISISPDDARHSAKTATSCHA